VKVGFTPCTGSGIEANRREQVLKAKQVPMLNPQ
jgi:hypothetical protein